jgi:uncharacterized protein DUF6636
VTRHRAALPLAVAALAALPASAALAAAPQRFQTPSRQIACMYLPAGGGAGAQLRCDLLFLNDRAAVLGRHGRARLVKITDTVADPRAKVLAYGHRVRVGVFTCTSRRTGLTCRNSRTGHGFFVSREKRRLW